MKIRWVVGMLAASTLASTMAACSGDDNVVATPSDGGAIDGTTNDGGTGVDGGNDGGADAAKGSADIQILTISDWHGQLDPISENDSMGVSQSYGGLSVLSTYFTQEKATNPNTLVLTAGDEFGATPPLSGIFEDKPTVLALNLLGLAADTFGNHNFDNGTDFLKARIGEANYKFVSTNLTNVSTELGAAVVTPYLILSVGQTDPKVKVALLGITNPDAPDLVFPGVLKTITVKEPIAAANAAAVQARAAGADVVVALAHLGATGKDMNNMPTGPLVDFAKGLTGVDLVVGDHTDFVVNGTFGSALVVENRSKGRTYAKIQLKVTAGALASKTATIVDPLAVQTALLTGCDAATCTCPTIACPTGFTCSSATAGSCRKTVVTPDPAADTLLMPYRMQLATKFDVKVGTIATLFARDSSQAERLGEVPIGDLVADAMLAKYKMQGVQIAFTNGGGLRAPLPSSYAPADTTLHRVGGAYNQTPPFDLVVGDIYTVLPFGNSCVVRKITGALLWQVLEKAVFAEPARYGGFLQIAGFKYTYSIGAAPGSRIQSVTLLDGTANGTPILNDTTQYTIVTNDFTNAGGDGYAMLKETMPSPTRDIVADVLLASIKANTPITVPTAGRITQLP